MVVALLAEEHFGLAGLGVVGALAIGIYVVRSRSRTNRA